MASTDPELRSLLNDAIAATRESYRAAVADQIEGVDDTESWQRVHRSISRALALAALIARARITRALKAMGVEFEFNKFEPDVVKFQRFGIESSGPLLSGEFTEAVRSFETRVPNIRETVEPLLRESQRLSQAMVNAEREDVIQDLQSRSRVISEALNRKFWTSDSGMGQVVNLRSLVADAIRGHEPDDNLLLPDFIDRARLREVENLTDARLEVVYRNNLNRNYNNAQAELLTDQNVRAAVPLAEITEIQDNRTRETHKPMDGYVNTVDRLQQQNVIPPSGHNCRGGLRPIPLAEAVNRGFANEDGTINEDAIRRHNGDRQALIDSGLYPDPGWAN